MDKDSDHMKSFVILTLAIFSFSFSTYLYLNFGSLWKAQPETEIQLFHSEDDLILASFNHKTPAQDIEIVKNGEQLSVVWDTYGKDYWACYVRTPQRVRGWVLCTELLRI